MVFAKFLYYKYVCCQLSFVFLDEFWRLSKLRPSFIQFLERACIFELHSVEYELEIVPRRTLINELYFFESMALTLDQSFPNLQVLGNSLIVELKRLKKFEGMTFYLIV